MASRTYEKITSKALTADYSKMPTSSRPQRGAGGQVEKATTAKRGQVDQARTKTPRKTGY